MKEKNKFPSPIYQAIPTSPEDLLQVECISSTNPVELTIEGIAVDLEGNLVPFQFTLNVPTALTVTTLRPKFGYNYLLSVSVITRTASIPDGSCYCRVAMVQSQTGGVFPFRKLLCQGYVSTYSSIGYGSNAINGAPGKNSFIENIEISNPAAGANFSYSCPDYTRLRIIAFCLRLDTSIQAGNRLVTLVYTRPSGHTHNFALNVTIGDDNGFNIYCHINQGYALFTVGVIHYSLIPSWILEPGSSISSNTSALQTGDQFSDIALLAERQTIPFT